MSKKAPKPIKLPYSPLPANFWSAEHLGSLFNQTGKGLYPRLPEGRSNQPSLLSTAGRGGTISTRATLGGVS